MSGDDIVGVLVGVLRNGNHPSCVDSWTNGSGVPCDLCAERLNAADELQRLRNEIVRLRAEREAIEALHQPQEGLDEYMRPEPWCPACANYWPCPTYLLLHPEEERRDA